MISDAVVIIPTYNRAQLIGETLDSIIKQTYTEWECIVVDDGSTDETFKVLDSYKLRDSRITYHKRHLELPKGANSCRNLGFSKSSGKFIIWFDSDDLMISDHIQKKVKAIQNSGADFVVAQTSNFEGEQLLEPYIYDKKPYGIKASDFILLKIHWYTYDVMLKKEVAEKISWNEKMQSWQDYNYFCKMLLVTENGIYLDEVLTHRRLHAESIQKTLTKNKKHFRIKLLDNRLLTYNDVHIHLDLHTKRELIYGMMNLCFELAKFHIISREFWDVHRIVKKNLGFSSALFFRTSIYSSLILKKGNYFLEKAKRRVTINSRN